MADILKRPTAQMREWSRKRSLNLPATDGDGRPADGASLVVDPSVTPEGRDLELDLADLISSFRPEWQKVCAMLPGSTVTGVAEELGVSRKTVSRWVRAIRARFRAAGFGEFL